MSKKEIEKVVVVAKKRGRKAGPTSKPLIKDPLLDPFYIQVEDGSFTVLKEGEAIAWGFYHSLSTALEKIAKFKLASNKEKIFSLTEYIQSYEKSIDKLLQTIKF